MPLNEKKSQFISIKFYKLLYLFHFESYTTKKVNKIGISCKKHREKRAHYYKNII